MINLTNILVVLVLMLLGYCYGYLSAKSKFDGRPENMPKSFRVLQGVKFADRILTTSLVAFLIVYLLRF